MPKTTAPDLVSTAEAADILCCDVRTVNRWAITGRLHTFIKTPGRRGARMFERVEVERVRDENQTVRQSA